MQGANTENSQRPRFLTANDVAELLHYKRKTIYDLVAKNGIPFRKPRGRLLFIESEILAWAAGHQPDFNLEPLRGSIRHRGCNPERRYLHDSSKKV